MTTDKEIIKEAKRMYKEMSDADYNDFFRAVISFTRKATAEEYEDHGRGI